MCASIPLSGELSVKEEGRQKVNLPESVAGFVPDQMDSMWTRAVLQQEVTMRRKEGSVRPCAAATILACSAAFVKPSIEAASKKEVSGHLGVVEAMLCNATNHTSRLESLFPSTVIDRVARLIWVLLLIERALVFGSKQKENSCVNLSKAHRTAFWMDWGRVGSQLHGPIWATSQ